MHTQGGEKADLMCFWTTWETLVRIQVKIVVDAATQNNVHVLYFKPVQYTYLYFFVHRSKIGGWKDFYLFLFFEKSLEF